MRRRDGSSPRHAILADQVPWCRRNYPGFTVALQFLMSFDGKYFDRLMLRGPNDETVFVFFELSHFGSCGRPPKRKKKRTRRRNSPPAERPTNGLEAWRSLPVLAGRC